MKRDKQNLLHSLVDGQPVAHREATLLAAGFFLRRRRWRRMLLRTSAVAAMLFLGLLSIHRLTIKRPPPFTPAVASEQQVPALSDDELLALFPDTPVALATLDDGKKRLIFPRPGDAERFIR